MDGVEAFNRTIVELKSKLDKRVLHEIETFNRTIVELKLKIDGSTTIENRPLIVP